MMTRRKIPSVSRLSRLSLALIGSTLVVAVFVALATLRVGPAHGGPPPFVPIPAVASMATLSAPGTAVAANALLAHVPEDLRPTTPTAVHAAGPNGIVWTHGQQVCSLFGGQTGGCLDSFSKPVSLYLFGDKDGFTVAGIVPNVVKALVIHTSAGDVNAEIENNGFTAAVPANTSISGETVMLANGSRFSTDDPVQLPTAS